MGVGINFDRDDDYDGPMFGRHWLEDIDELPSFVDTTSKEALFKNIQKLNTTDLNWLLNKIINLKSKKLKKK